ncbi:MAG: ATP-binding protein [Eubacteriales bacterium]|uniref:ATP-binding protein n=1 Tax=Fenollaria sp. TaxID=1965292 RepID=UPI002A754F68|nr:ATP-binding protein [Fenollaria sp.]MDD7340036.1 ATP-binding protein [Eubacteriales bacterium]MDY3105996.1 ATP-binding protein [Fenollaria sp.]
MKVLGLTGTSEVYLASNERNFRINEFLLVEDEVKNYIGEVVEANTFNRFMPFEKENDFVDQSVIDSLYKLGYDVNNEVVYLAKLRLLEEAMYPIMAGSAVRVPEFDEIKSLIIKSSPKDGLVLGVIKNTDDLYKNADEELKNIVYTFENGERKNQKDLPYIFNVSEFSQYPHIGVFGGSGSGKSFALRVIIEELMKKRIPTIVLDPHYEMDFKLKTYDEAADYSSLYQSFLLGKDVGVDFKDLNVGEFKNLLNAAGAMTDAMDTSVDEVFKRGESVDAFRLRLSEILEALDRTEDALNMDMQTAELNGDAAEADRIRRLQGYQKTYGRKLNASSLKGISWRFRRLVQDNVFSNSSEALEAALRSGKLISLKGSTRLLEVYSSYILKKFYYKRRAYMDAKLLGTNDEDYFPPFIIITDEAHNFAPKSFESASKPILKEVAQEGRKYGVFLILATQRITLLDDTITAQLNTKFILRTVRESDIMTIKEETDISSDDAKRLPYLTTGDAFISEASFGRTIFTRFRFADTKAIDKVNPFLELKGETEDKMMAVFEEIKDNLPISDFNLTREAARLEKTVGTMSTEEFKDILERLADEGYISKRTNPFGQNEYIEKE